jgi:hypothetical protein
MTATARVTGALGAGNGAGLAAAAGAAPAAWAPRAGPANNDNGATNVKAILNRGLARMRTS